MSQSLPLVNPATSSCCLAKICPQSCLNKSTVIKASLVVFALLFVASAIFVGGGFGNSYLPEIVFVEFNQIIMTTTLGVVGLGFGLAVLEWNIIDLLQVKEAQSNVQPVKHAKNETPASSPVKRRNETPSASPLKGLAPTPQVEKKTADGATSAETELVAQVALPFNHPTHWQFQRAPGYDDSNSEVYECGEDMATKLIFTTGKDVKSIEPNLLQIGFMMSLKKEQCDFFISLEMRPNGLWLIHTRLGNPNGIPVEKDGVITLAYKEKFPHSVGDFIVLKDDIHTINITKEDGSPIITFGLPEDEK